MTLQKSLFLRRRKSNEDFLKWISLQKSDILEWPLEGYRKKGGGLNIYQDWLLVIDHVLCSFLFLSFFGGKTLLDVSKGDKCHQRHSIYLSSARCDFSCINYRVKARKFYNFFTSPIITFYALKLRQKNHNFFYGCKALRDEWQQHLGFIRKRRNHKSLMPFVIWQSINFLHKLLDSLESHRISCSYK